MAGEATTKAWLQQGCRVGLRLQQRLLRYHRQLLTGNPNRELLLENVCIDLADSFGLAQRRNRA